MSKTIDTLVDDIYELFSSDKVHEFDEEKVQAFGKAIVGQVTRRVNEAKFKPSLRMSNVGTKCKRKLWYNINQSELAEEISPAAKIKFLFGDILEEFLLFLAEEAGHKVEGRQDVLELEGIKGRRDAVIDGVLVDVKSTSSRSFDKFRNHLNPDSDVFGYLTQLKTYHQASRRDESADIPVDESKAGFLVIDKQLGHIYYDEHQFSERDDLSAEINTTKEIVKQLTPPARGYDDVPDGKSGNRKLGTECSYCPFKFACWPGLRTYHYSTGPRFLTRVIREPKVNEA